MRVELEFTNTTPDPSGRFSVFEEIRLAVHDEATDSRPATTRGRSPCRTGARKRGQRVHVATIQLREGIRYEDSVSVELTYVLPDTEGGAAPGAAVGRDLSGVELRDLRRGHRRHPAGYEMRVDGDPLTEDGDTLVSGPIEDPAEWLALVTAVAPAEHASHHATVPLEGGTADLVVRAFADDDGWGTRTLETVSAALPIIEAELGLPYPLRGQLILVETVPATIAGFGESSTTGTEIPVSFDQPPFTALHQVTHVWLPPRSSSPAGSGRGSPARWRTVGAELDIDPPFDPVAEAEAHADAAFPLDAWSSTPDPEADAYGYAASWAILDEIEAAAGADAIPAVLARVAGSVGSYEPAEVAPEPVTDGATDPAAPLTSRSFLDHLENVTDADLAPLFEERVLTEADVALLGPRADAREAFDALVAGANGWGAPDPVASAMADWRFDEAVAQMADASAWLADRDEVLEQMADAGLSAPDRLHQAYRAYGGGAEAESELESERDVVEAYIAAAAR